MRIANEAEVALMLADIANSYRKARAKHAPMRGPHEGYAVLLEEFDELWDEIKQWQPEPKHPFDAPPIMSQAELDELLLQYHRNTARIRKEALHVAAMSLAFLLEAVEYTE